MEVDKQKEEIIELTDLALNHIKKAGCEGFINAEFNKEFSTRFSNSEILQNYVDLNRGFEVTVIYDGKQRASSTTNVLSEQGIIKMVDYLVKVAKIVPPDPMYPGLLKEEQKYPKLSLNDPKAHNLEPDHIVDKIEGAFVAGHAVDDKIGGISGNMKVINGYRLFASTEGHHLLYPTTTYGSVININALQGTEESRSNSTFGHRRFDSLGLETEASVVANRAVNALGAETIEPGEYEVIFDHQAVSTILFLLGYATSSRMVVNRRSFLADKIGEKVLDPSITLINDPHNSELLSARPIDDEGLATQKFPVFENGVLKNFSFSRLDAARMNAIPKGTGFSFFGSTVGFPFAGVMEKGKQSKQQMISEMKDGLLVTNLHYTNYVNPPVGSITGMTKDGLFRIRDGEIVGSAKNMRFTDVIPRFLSEANVGNELKQPTSSGLSNLVAPIRVDKFKFTSKTGH